MRIRPDWKLSCFQRRFAQLAHFEHGGRGFRPTPPLDLAIFEWRGSLPRIAPQDLWATLAEKYVQDDEWYPSGSRLLSPATDHRPSPGSALSISLFVP